MEKFELKVDLNTPYIKAIRFFGIFMLGFFIAAIVFKFKHGIIIDWMNALTGILLSIIFAFYPGLAQKKSLTVDEEGIYLNNYTFTWGGKKQYKWSEIKAVEVEKNRIKLKNSIGSTEKIKLPIYTKEQIKNLRTYLKKLTDAKQIEYLN